MNELRLSPEDLFSTNSVYAQDTKGLKGIDPGLHEAVLPQQRGTKWALDGTKVPLNAKGT